MNVVYIAGPYRGPNAWAIAENVRTAERAALEVWKMGAAALCPHTNTANFQGAAPDEVWLEGDLEMLRRCDAVYALPTFHLSTGAKAEIAEAERRHIPVFYKLADLFQWLRTPEATDPYRRKR